MSHFRYLSFLTDYGLDDGFAAACRGVCARIAPHADIIDVTHLIPRGDVRRGAAVLAQTVPYLPPAVHVAVVDPGVGTARRGVAVAAGDSVFVGPDNGLLSWAVAALGGAARAFNLTSRDLWLQEVTATFHGRDIFMPVAAHLAAGAELASAGTEIPVADLVTLPVPERQIRDSVASGEVLTVDRFGNVQLTITASDAAEIGVKPGGAVLLGFGHRQLLVPYRDTFGAVAQGELVSYADSAGLVSIAVNGGDAAGRLGLPPGARVTVAAAPPTTISPLRIPRRPGAWHDDRGRANIGTAVGRLRRRYPTRVSRQLLRGTLLPFATGLAAVIAALGVLASAPPALGATTRPADAVRDQEWWLSGLRVTQAWRTSEGAGIIVAVLGTGVTADHPDLVGSVITGPDYSGSAPLGRVPGSPYWGVEGTAVAGIIAGHGANGDWGTGIVGIAPLAKILSVRVTLEFNDPLASDQAISQRLPGAIADGITYAVAHGARVIDLPLDPGTLGMTSAGDPAAAGGSAAERAAVALALSRNVVLVAPAGDDGAGSQIVNYPAAYPGVIAVGATDRAGQLASFSSRRSGALLTAPGVGLVTAAPPNAYNQISSTSAAGGIVAGLAALILSRFPHLTVAQVTRALIESTVTTAGATGLPPLPSRPGTGTGYGTADAVRALQMAAFINAASQPPPPATRPARAHKPAPRAAASPSQKDTSTLAGSVLRGAVAGVVLLIVLLGGTLLVMRSRRGRGRPAGPAGRAQGAPRAHRAHGVRVRGQHEHRRPERAAAGTGTAARDDAAMASRPPPAATPVPRALDTWPSPGGWQGGGIGEIGYASSALSRPAMAPPPIPTGSRASRGVQDSPSGPPWEPAPEPGRMAGSLPVRSAGGPVPEPGTSIRVPGGMAAPPGPAAGSAPPADSGMPTAPASFDLATPPEGFDVSAPAFGLKPPAFGAAAPPRPDLPGADLPARDQLDFAAAPVPADYAAPPADEPVTRDYPPPAPPPDPSYIWNLALTDVFPAAGAPDAPSAPDEDSGADES